MKTMPIDNVQPSFQAKVADRFVKSMRGFVNGGENRLKNNYRLTQKIEEYAKFGYDDYTVELHQKMGSLGVEYRLVAVKDGESAADGIVLTKPYNAYRKAFYGFMNMKRYDFYRLMNKKNN